MFPATGTLGSGSRKKYSVKRPKTNQSTINMGNAAADTIVPTTAAKATNAQSTAPAKNVRKMSLKAAFLALPECFIQTQVTV